ncbi:MAG TPA: extracellular solute-binding protein [Caldilineaceae bacterium]|nr:extracellular solute-binding protein [Caldilineaceae bacterium]
MLIDTFSAFEERHTGVKITFGDTSRQHLEKLMAKMSGGVPPDIFAVHVAWMVQVAEAEQLVDWRPYAETNPAATLDDYFPAQLGFYTYKRGTAAHYARNERTSETALLATLAILSFIHHWNEFLRPLIYLGRPELRTLALGLRAFRGEYQLAWNYVMAVALVMLLPILILFFFAQRQFVQGIAMTGIKG